MDAVNRVIDLLQESQRNLDQTWMNRGAEFACETPSLPTGSGNPLVTAGACSGTGPAEFQGGMAPLATPQCSDQMGASAALLQRVAPRPSDPSSMVAAPVCGDPHNLPHDNG